VRITLLKSKLHRATVTDADLSYEGSITIDADLCQAAQLLPYEKVDVYNCNTGARFATYVMPGDRGEICINGAAVRLAHKGDPVIIASYGSYEAQEAQAHQPILLLLDAHNQAKIMPNLQERKPLSTARHK
jgi:aspartate 1-decarboxylase